ncbi:lycopene cyclase domain-containing protein [Brevibacterium sp. Re57]|uniref:Lycopene cyclase domain-containing protein n=2 Tax=Brevibacterium gallinarum TaxID=2762220 RepID=A0ABR8WUJ2_9MICO|nr:lycopene cyclase domain-containing protein [Brevibacterium gallinarum]
MTASRSRIHQRALAITAALLIGLTMIFDNLMIAAGLFTYDNHLGISIGLMPIEDLAYTIVAVAALPSLWLLLGHRRTPRRPDDANRPSRPDDADRRGGS